MDQKGTTVGVIKTPMSDTNVGRKNTPTVHNYDKATGNPPTTGGSGIKGPGVGDSEKPNKPGRW